MKTSYKKIDIKGFRLQSGSVLDLELAYQTYGTLNLAKDNIVLYPTYFAGRHTDNEWLIGRGKALDPEKFFIVVPNLFGNGLSSSPSNTTGKHGGIWFPDTSIYDNIIAQHFLLTEYFGITKIKLAIGWSLGAMQVYGWAALFPDLVEKMVAFGGASKNSTRFQLIADTVISALKADENWMNGHYDAQPEKGVRLMARIYCAWAYSHSYFKEKLYIKKEQTPSLEDFIKKRWENAFLKYDANDILKMLETGRNGNLADHPTFGGDFEKALGAIKAKVLLMPGSTDLFFPVEDSIYEAQHILDARVVPIPSIWGHESGIGINKKDNEFIDHQVKIFLASEN